MLVLYTLHTFIIKFDYYTIQYYKKNTKILQLKYFSYNIHYLFLKLGHIIFSLKLIFLLYSLQIHILLNNILFLHFLHINILIHPLYNLNLFSFIIYVSCLLFIHSIIKPI